MTDTEVLMGIIGLIILVLLVSPFFAKKYSALGTPEDDFQDEKEQVFTQLSELEYDYQMGKLSQRDYIHTKNDLTATASKFVTSSNFDENIDIERQVDTEINTALNKEGIRKAGLYED